MLFLLQALWVSSNITLVICIAALLWRKRQKQLPIFTGYLLLSILQFCLLFTIAHRQPFQQEIYHWAESLCLIIGTFWTLAVIYEITKKLLLVHPSTARFSHRILQASLAVLVLASVAGAGNLSGWSVYRITNISERLDFSSNLILTGMFLAIAALQRSLNISWRNWITGIALGFGVSASVSLVAAALLAAFGKGVLKATDILNLAGFQACALIWVVYLVLPERPSIPPPSSLQERDLERWSDEVEKMMPR